MKVRTLLLAVSLALCALIRAEQPFHATADDGGVVVGVSLSDVREGAAARLMVTLNDRASQAPLRSVFPSAWLSATGSGDEKPCAAKVAAFLSGSLLQRADIDLNVYEVAALNGDGTITVVDPRFSFGGSRLLAMIDLKGPGYDWALTAGGSRLVVSVPSANRIAIIDTSTWTMTTSVEATQPMRVVAQPESDVVWVAAGRELLAVRSNGETAARVRLGEGARDLAITDDGAYVVAVNKGNALIIATETGAVTARVKVAKEPRSIAWSALSRMMYVAAADGAITAIDPASPSRRASITSEPGVRVIRFSRDGRFGFIVNPEKDLVSVIDAATNRIIQRGIMEGGPFDVAFSEGLAYIRMLRSEVVLMVPLADLGKPGHPINVVDFPAGQEPFGKGSRLIPADGIVSAPGEGAVLVAHPGDHNIYYYREGMAAPMGHFSNYSHEPQAVLAIDRTLRPVTAGTFATTTRLPHAGTYTLAVFLDSPRTVACFDVAVKEDPEHRAREARGPLVEQLTEERVIPPGEKLRVRYRFVDPASGRALAHLRDANVLVYLAATGWSERTWLQETASGIYEADVKLPSEGVYYAFVESASGGLRPNNPSFLILEARR